MNNDESSVSTAASSVEGATLTEIDTESAAHTSTESQSAKIIPFPRAQPAWVGQEPERWFQDDDWDDTDPPPSSVPLDINSRDDRNSDEPLDHPGAFTRTTYDDLVDAYEDAEACKRLFGVTKLDDNLEKAMLASIHHFTAMMRDPAATLCGLYVGSLLVFMENHPAFRRNFRGPARIAKSSI
jgi:hypothetical protein